MRCWKIERKESAAHVRSLPQLRTPRTFAGCESQRRSAEYFSERTFFSRFATVAVALYYQTANFRRIRQAPRQVSCWKSKDKDLNQNQRLI